MTVFSRRGFLQHSATASGVAALLIDREASGSLRQPQIGFRVEDPRTRVPASFIIDDSTCLVNMGHFCMPQFAAAWPDRPVYRKPWNTWPREIPDTFVREFAEWCAAQGVKGKYSVVPNPACVGWLDRGLPGWSRRQLQDSLKLIRNVLLPNWDIHPEMITHTRVIDLKTGRPLAEIGPATMENSYPRTKVSVDYLASYLAYALRILKNCDLPCEGVTTPGGFGNMVKSELSLAAQQALRDVYQTEIPHYFKYVRGNDESTEPVLEHLNKKNGNTPELTVNVPAGTGDWFGGWDGDRDPEGPRYCNADASAGRMVDLIERGQPAVMLCHWPGMYSQGTKRGFAAFQGVVTALNTKYRDRMQWMKLSEIARYWTARTLTHLGMQQNKVVMQAPFACPNFTISSNQPLGSTPRLIYNNRAMQLREVSQSRQLESMTFVRTAKSTICCFALPQGRSELAW